jgi:hypothetical protein
MSRKHSAGLRVDRKMRGVIFETIRSKATIELKCSLPGLVENIEEPAFISIPFYYYHMGGFRYLKKDYYSPQ